MKLILSSATAALMLVASALSTQAATINDPVYGTVELLPDGALKVPTTHGSYAIVYRAMMSASQAQAITGDMPAQLIHRYTENTVAPSASEIQQNPFLASAQ